MQENNRSVLSRVNSKRPESKAYFVNTFLLKTDTLPWKQTENQPYSKFDRAMCEKKVFLRKEINKTKKIKKKKTSALIISL